MKQTLNTCLFLFVALLSLKSPAQNENAKWYFGYGAGLDFMTSPPTVLTNGALSTMEGCSTMSNASGNLLFYTDGITVWNNQHTTMANGTGLLGGWSTTQSALIVKQPGSSNLYFIFSMSSNATGVSALSYCVVDMALAAGMGSVTTKNILLDSTNTEKLAGIRHCNKVDVWILTHDAGNSDFSAYLLNSGGINPTPVISYSVGTSHSGANIGYLKASPNGMKLGTCFGSNIVLCDFNKATGQVSNPLSLGTFTFAYGCEFSPDGSKFYAVLNIVPNNPIHQWDLCAGNGPAIVASHTVIGNASGVTDLGCLQRAIDGRIYVAYHNHNALGVINNPNVSGTGCNFVHLGQSVAPKMSGYGLQNIVNDFSNPVSSECVNTADCNTLSLPEQLSGDANIFRIYPNPVNGNLYLETKTAGRLIILNQVGNIVFEDSFENGKHRINMSSFGTGIYMVKLISDEYAKTSRIIKVD